MADSVQSVMTRNPKALPSSSTIVDAACAMRDLKIGNVIVVDDANKVCGIVTDRDLVVKVLAAGSDANKTTLGSVCSKDVTALKPTQTIDDAVQIMRDKAIRRLPIVDGGNLVGIVSLGDLAEHMDKASCLGQISAARPNN